MLKLSDSDITVLSNLIKSDTARARSLEKVANTTLYMDKIRDNNNKLLDKLSSLLNKEFNQFELDFLKELLVNENLRMNHWRSRQLGALFDRLQDQNNKIIKKLTYAENGF